MVTFCLPWTCCYPAGWALLTTDTLEQQTTWLNRSLSKCTTGEAESFDPFKQVSKRQHYKAAELQTLPKGWSFLFYPIMKRNTEKLSTQQLRKALMTSIFNNQLEKDPFTSQEPQDSFCVRLLFLGRWRTRFHPENPWQWPYLNSCIQQLSPKISLLTNCKLSGLPKMTGKKKLGFPTLSH